MSDQNPPPEPDPNTRRHPDMPPPGAPGSPGTPGTPPAGTSADPAATTPLYKRPWFIVVAVIVVLTVLFGGGDDTGDTPTAPGPPATGPAPEADPEPEPEPEPEPAPEPEPEPEVTFDPVVLEGSGDDIIDVPVVADLPVVATFTHRGSSNFAVVSYDENGGRLDLLVNTIGTYDGTVPLNFTTPPAELEISADGPWTVTITDVRDQPVYDGAASGTGDQVLLVTTDAGRLAAAHDGTSNFVIIAWGDRRSLLVNEIGAYSGTVRLPDAVALEINADGAWTLEEG